MILNEDFFNDIKIKDEDLTTEVPNLTHKEYNVKTSRELIEYEISESEMVLKILINFFNGKCNNICHRIERIMKRVKYMFDIYNINISEPFITYSDISFEILKDKKFPNKNANYILIQHEGCNLYFPEDKLRTYGPDETVKDDIFEAFVFLDKKLPVFKTAKSAYNFLIGLDKCLWKDVTDPKDECFRWCNFYDIDNVYVNKQIIETFCDSNSYVNDDATRMYKSVLNIVPEELAEQLRNIERSKFSDKKQLKKMDLETIIKMMTKQQKLY